jgi:hypothetical protein
MAFEYFSYDPLTGVRTLFDYDEDTDTAIFRREQDVEGVLAFAAECRRQETTRKNLKRDDYFCLHSTIPAMVEVELLKKGLSLNREEDLPKIAREIETNYPNLKCTDLKLWRPT